MDFPFSMTILWVIILIIMIVAELMTLGLTTIWFAGGAIAGLIAAAAGANVYIQIILFIVVSIILMLAIRPWARKHFNHGREKTNAQSLIGQTGIVIEAIDNVRAEGRVTIRGMEWAARNVVDEPIAKDAQVKVLKISGVKLIVEEEKEIG